MENGSVKIPGRVPRVRISDIAQKSGVSISTVSIVLHNKPGIPAETRQRVLDAAEELGYRFKNRNPFNNQEVVKQIGVVMKSMPLPNVFYSDILAGIDNACKQYHLNLMFTSMTTDYRHSPMELPRMIQRADFDGLLLLGTYLEGEFEQEFLDLDIPIILVDGYALTGKNDAVVIDNFGGAYSATELLIKLGHKKIGIVGSRTDGFPGVIMRRNGFLQAIHDYGLEANYFANSWLEPITVVEPATQLLTEHPEITAVFCCTDEMALKVIEVAHKLGRKVPESLSVVGFDDIDWSSRATPTITTVRVDRYNMGQLAVMALLNRVNSPEAHRITYTIQTILMERDSAAPYLK